jgi:hypothetical protein
MSKNPNTLHLNAFLMSVGHHEASWRLPESDPYAGWDVRHYQELARIAERGRLDSLFLADSPVQQGHPGRRPTGKLEPTLLLTALAAVTEHIGLIATASTSYNEPYNLRTAGSSPPGTPRPSSPPSRPSARRRRSTATSRSAPRISAATPRASRSSPASCRSSATPRTRRASWTPSWNA